jgi:hypothetical protein
LRALYTGFQDPQGPWILTHLRRQKTNGGQSLGLFILGQPRQAAIAKWHVKAVMTPTDEVAWRYFRPTRFVWIFHLD